jgi:hypothetical protein
MNTQEQSHPRTWLTVDQAFVACQTKGLNRTKKTIRSWCRHEHVESQKQSTPTGERWMVEETSLTVKIQSELEFIQQKPDVQTGTNPSEPVQTTAEPVRTRADQSELGQTRSYDSEQAQTHVNPSERERELETRLRSLEIDKAVRDKQIDFFTKQNEEGQRSLLSQSRYIGHLETQVMRLGGQPDQAFLQAPVPQSPINQDQRPLDGVH